MLDALLAAIKANPAQTVTVVKAALPALTLLAPVLVASIPDDAGPVALWAKHNPSAAVACLTDLIALLDAYPEVSAALVAEVEARS